MEYKVSFCIPVYNKSDATYQLVTGLLSNPNKEFQVVICDNASSDDTVERLGRIRDSRLKVVVNPKNIGAKGNWYRALEEGDGQFLYFVIGRDQLNPKKIEDLIDVLRDAERKGVKLLKDGPCGKQADEKGRLQIFCGIEAVKRFLDIEHPTGLIYERNAYRSLNCRKKYYQYSDTYPENWIKRDLIAQYNKAAKISANVYFGKSSISLKKIKSGYEDTQIPFYYPQKRTEQHIHILDMVEYSRKFNLSKKEYDEFFVNKCERMFSYVSWHWRSCMQNPVHAGHYAHEIRLVSQREMIGNVLKAYKTVNRYYKCEMNFLRKIKVWYVVVKKIQDIIVQS